MGGREFPRYPSGEFRTLFRVSVDDPLQIGECEFLASPLSIIYRPREASRIIILRDGNQSVMSWVFRARSNSSAPNRLLRHLCLVCRVYGLDVLPLYIRSGRNFAADNLDRWSDEEVEKPPQQEGMEGVNAAGVLSKSTDLLYNASPW